MSHTFVCFLKPHKLIAECQICQFQQKVFSNTTIAEEVEANRICFTFCFLATSKTLNVPIILEFIYARGFPSYNGHLLVQPNE